MALLFDCGESLVKGIVASNKHEKVDAFMSCCTQEGGTRVVIFGETASLMNMEGSGCGASGLG